jgi:hypothetical protein
VNFTLTQEQYEALIAFAQRGATTSNEALTLDAFLKDIERTNNITRYILWVQWQEQDQPLPPTTEFPAKWPPEMRHKIEFLSRPVGSADVDQVLKLKARKPVTVLVTPDPAGVLGWTKREDFFVR